MRLQFVRKEQNFFQTIPNADFHSSSEIKQLIP